MFRPADKCAFPPSEVLPQSWRVIHSHPMSLQELELAVQTLPASDLREFFSWFDDWRAEQWDRQIEQDAQAGKLDHLAEAALAEFRAGQFTRLP